MRTLKPKVGIRGKPEKKIDGKEKDKKSKKKTQGKKILCELLIADEENREEKTVHLGNWMHVYIS